MRIQYSWPLVVAIIIASLLYGCADDGPSAPPAPTYTDTPITPITPALLDDLLMVRPLTDTTGFWRVYDKLGCTDAQFSGRIPALWLTGSIKSGDYRTGWFSVGVTTFEPRSTRSFGYRWMQDIRTGSVTLDVCCHTIPLTNAGVPMFCNGRESFKVLEVSQKSIHLDGFTLTWQRR
jgi:hypothetical protein